MASSEDVTALRSMLAEDIPPSGTEADTLFSDLRIDQLVTAANGNLEAAAYNGWREKAGQLANLADVSDGAAARKLSQLQSNALSMVKVYSRASSGPTEGRTRVGKIVRAK